MGKRKDKKRRRIRIISKSRKNFFSRRNPKAFFRTIGIKPQGSGEEKYSDIEKALLNDPELQKALDSTREDSEYFFHDNLALAKVLYGVGHKRIYRIADELARLPVPPKSQVLDIGGGPGHLAFWMAKAWDCPVTVADQCSQVGEQWAREIGEDRVNFVDALLPDLEPLKGEQYDIVVLSRVLINILLRTLPGRVTFFSTRDYLDSPEAKERLDRTEELLEGVIRVLAPEGKVVVVDSWSDAWILLMAKAFERKGLFVDLDFFSPERVDEKYSAIAFSRSPLQTSYVKDLPMALAATVNFGKAPTVGFGGTVSVGGWAAELIRTFFGDVPPRMILECKIEDEDDEGILLNEILEREGLALWYKTSTTGDKSAILCPAIEIPRLIEELQRFGRELETQNGGKIMRQFLSETNGPKQTQDAEMRDLGSALTPTGELEADVIEKIDQQ